eukprot:Tamp_02800.p1 GENE.Tamp_02800~~Tamp_02800.p1  ORF type:complete len:527 (-),score=116.05 Tamp_02800:2449-4029(-)
MAKWSYEILAAVEYLHAMGVSGWSLTCSHVVGSQLRCTPIFLPSPRSIFACVLRFGATNMVVRIGGSSTRERSGPEVMQTDGLGEMSEETMSKRRQVYERLYSMGVVKVKKQQHMQEQKRREQEEKLKKERQQVNAKSMKMSAARKPDMGANYGEFLYNQGMERRDLKAEQVRLIKHNEQMEEEKETTFTPRISETSKNLRRDMPVVERLFMLDQVKAEKIGTLKRAVELEERRKGTFAPQINPNYQLKKGARTDVTKSHLDTQKRAFQRQAMQERLDRELGVTHKPTLNDRSRQIAGNASNRSSATPDNNIFARLYKEAEERERQYQVKRIEAHLVTLDLASTTVKGSRGRPTGTDGERKGKDAEVVGIEGVGSSEEVRDSGRQPHVPLWEILYAEAQKAKERKHELEKQLECKAREERKQQKKMNTKSQDLSQKRLRKEVKGILEQMGFIQSSSSADGGGRAVDGDVDGELVEFPAFCRAIEAVVEKGKLFKVWALLGLCRENTPGKTQSTVPAFKSDYRKSAM